MKIKNIKHAACGRPAIAMSQAGLRIINGVAAIPHSHPWHVIVTDKDFSFLCAGSLISNQFVLTAAHVSLIL